MFRKNKIRYTRQEISKMNADMVTSQLLRERYLAKKAAYEASEQGLKDRESRKQQQAKFVVQEAQREAMVKELQNLRKYLFEHILRDLDLEDKPQQNLVLDMDKVVEVMRKYEPNLKFLKESCIKYEKMQDKKYSYQFIRLYKDLIAINHVFIEFAPVMTFYNSTDIVQEIGSKIYVSYKESFINRGFFDDEIFAMSNKERFTGLTDIATITDFDKVKKELKANPALYPYINPSIKDTMMNSEVALKDMLRCVPDIVHFMTEKELLYVGEVCTNTMGRLIIKAPVLMTKLPKHFFRINSPKFVFASYPKKQIHLAVSRYYDLQPELKEYMQSYIDALDEKAQPIATALTKDKAEDNADNNTAVNL